MSMPTAPDAAPLPAQRQSNPRLLVFDLDKLKQVGEIGSINAHGAVVDAKSNHGFASSKPITMFDTATMATITAIMVDGNPDGLTCDQNPAGGSMC